VELGSGRTRVHVGGQGKYQKSKDRIADIVVRKRVHILYCGYLEYDPATYAAFLSWQNRLKFWVNGSYFHQIEDGVKILQLDLDLEVTISLKMWLQ
jgi:hypothetical protein